MVSGEASVSIDRGLLGGARGKHGDPRLERGFAIHGGAQVDSGQDVSPKWSTYRTICRPYSDRVSAL